MPEIALGQHVGAQRHRRAHDRYRQRFADAGGVAAQQVDLQLGERVGRDPNLGEVAESGVDAVDRLVAAREGVDDRARRVDTGTRIVGQRHRRLIARRSPQRSSSVSELPSRENHVRVLRRASDRLE